MSKYFVHCAENGFDMYETEQEARIEAQDRIDSEVAPPEGWFGNIDTITWGKVLGVTQQVNIKTSDEE